jgi:cyclophilin family peptidyl-prolyl cis-trans isomerase
MRSHSLLPGLLFLLALNGSGWGAADETEAATAPKAVIETSMGAITLVLDVKRAPISVANFLSYADRGFYDDTIFHRVVVGFVVQGGGYDAALIERESDSTIHNEADNGLKNLRGTIAMARNDDIDSASNQFFINTSDNATLDHSQSSCTRAQQQLESKARERGMIKPRTCATFGYAVFGKVIGGMDVVEEIELVDTDSKDGFEDLPVEPVIIHTVRRL